jgi:hypothetical protein
MFCPRCSQPQTSGRARFCPRCGFQLDEVKALVEREEALSADERARAESLLPRQKDLSIGAGLMFAGGLVATLWAFVLGAAPLDVLLPQAFFVLGFTLAFVLLFFHPLTRTLHKLFAAGDQYPHQLSRQQDGINLGAILMFVGTLKAMLLASLLHPDRRAAATLLFMAGGFLLLLFIRRLVQAVYGLLFKGGAKEEATTEDASDPTMRLDGRAPGASLPPARGVPAGGLRAHGSRAAETAPRPSVTEHTTEFLDRE